MQRLQTMQTLLDATKKEFTISDNFVESSDHPYSCRCNQCLQWWVTVGPEDLGHGWGFGPFTEQEFISAGGVVEPYETTYEDDDEVPF